MTNRVEQAGNPRKLSITYADGHRRYRHWQQLSFTLTRGQAAARLGVSTSTVRRYEWDRLHPHADGRGVWRFDPAEVDALRPLLGSKRTAQKLDARSVERRAQAKSGRVAAQVFRLFARSFTLPQIVVTSHQPPEVVRALYHEWCVALEQGEWERTTR